jgi:two-component system chemotaxis response regulator CheB
VTADPVQPRPVLPRPVDAVAIGTSAGGFEALSVVLPALPAGLAVPVFVVIHLPGDRPSRVAELLASKCRVPVVEAEDKAPAAPGIVYLAPPDYHLLIEAGPALALSADEPVHFSRPSIDVLFESAADAFGAGLLGIILTGSSPDGAVGLRAVHRAGGTTIVQDPREARVPLMAEAALRLTTVDLTLPLDGIAAVLQTLDHA